LRPEETEVVVCGCELELAGGEVKMGWVERFSNQSSGKWEPMRFSYYSSA
jgi:hypothetical protein